MYHHFRQVFINIHLHLICLNKNIIYIQRFFIPIIGSTDRITLVYIFKIHGSTLSAQVLTKPLSTLHVPMCTRQHFVNYQSIYTNVNLTSIQSYPQILEQSVSSSLSYVKAKLDLALRGSSENFRNKLKFLKSCQ